MRRRVRMGTSEAVPAQRTEREYCPMALANEASWLSMALMFARMVGASSAICCAGSVNSPFC